MFTFNEELQNIAKEIESKYLDDRVEMVSSIHDLTVFVVILTQMIAFMLNTDKISTEDKNTIAEQTMRILNSIGIDKPKDVPTILEKLVEQREDHKLMAMPSVGGMQ